MREGAEGSCGSHKEGARWVVWRPLDRSLMVSKKTIVLIETYSADGWGISDRFSPDNEKKFSYWPWTASTRNWKQITAPIGPIFPENVFSSRSQADSSENLLFSEKLGDRSNVIINF